MYTQFENARDRLSTWVLYKLPVARQLHEFADQICNKTARRLINIFVNMNLPPVADNPQTNRYYLVFWLPVLRWLLQLRPLS